MLGFNGVIRHGVYKLNWKFMKIVAVMGIQSEKFLGVWKKKEKKKRRQTNDRIYPKKRMRT